MKLTDDDFDEMMPIWLPPSPPSSDADFDLRMEDDNLDFMYEIELMSEARLPQATHEVRRPPLIEKQKQNQQQMNELTDMLLSSTKDKDSVYDAVSKCLQMPSTEAAAASPAYTENSFSMDDTSQDSKMEPLLLSENQQPGASNVSGTVGQVAGGNHQLTPQQQQQLLHLQAQQNKAKKRRNAEARAALNRSADSCVKRATTPPPAWREEVDFDGAEWNIVEDNALLQAVQLELANSHLVEKSESTPGMVLNWELVSLTVCKHTRFYRSARQCSIRYQMFVRPKELGQLVTSHPITKQNVKVELSTTELSHLRRGRMTTDSQYAHDYGILTDKKHVNRFKTVKIAAAKKQVQFWRGQKGKDGGGTGGARCEEGIEQRNLQSLDGGMPPRHEARMAEFNVRTGIVLDAEEVVTMPDAAIEAYEASKKKLYASRQQKPSPRQDNRFHTLVLRPYTVPVNTELRPLPLRRDMVIAVPPLEPAPVPVTHPPLPVMIQGGPPVAGNVVVGQGGSGGGGLQNHPTSSNNHQNPSHGHPTSSGGGASTSSGGSQPLPPIGTIMQQPAIPMRQQQQVVEHHQVIPASGNGGMMTSSGGGGGGGASQHHHHHQGSLHQGSHQGHMTPQHQPTPQQPTIQRRTASVSNVQYLQQQGNQGQSYVVMNSNAQSSSQHSNQGGGQQNTGGSGDVGGGGGGPSGGQHTPQHAPQQQSHQHQPHQQQQRVQYVPQGAGRGSYANTLVMQRGGRVVRPTGTLQSGGRLYIEPRNQYAPNVVPVRVMPNQGGGGPSGGGGGIGQGGGPGGPGGGGPGGQGGPQRMMVGQRRTAPMPGTVAAMVLPNRGNGGVSQIRTMQRGANYGGVGGGGGGGHHPGQQQQRINVMVQPQNMRQNHPSGGGQMMGAGGSGNGGGAVRRQLIGRPLQRVDQSGAPTVAQVVVAPPQGLQTSGGPPVLHLQRSSMQLHQVVSSSSHAPPPPQAPPTQQAPPPPTSTSSGATSGEPSSK